MQRILRLIRRRGFQNLSLVRPLFIFVLTLSLFFLMVSYADERVIPYLEEASVFKTDQIINEIIDNAVLKTIEINGDKFIDIGEKEEGRIAYIKAEVPNINIYALMLSEEIQDKIKNLKKDKILLPIGCITEKNILSASGPKIGYTILPIGKALVQPRSVFSEAGINQTIYKLFMDIEIDVKIICPLLKKNSYIKRTVLISETIIIGEVPYLVR